MADYDFSGLDDVLKKTPTAPIAPPVPVSAPEAAQPKYDFSSLDTPNDQAASAAKAAALFEASFRNPSEEAKKRNLSDTIQRMSGEYVSPAVMDVGEAQRQADRLAADHATRASPRTSAFLSVQENANVAMHDAKVMAQIEESFKTVVRGAPEAVGNLARYGGVLLDAAVKPFGLQSELTGFGKWIDKSLEKAIPLQPVEAGVLSEGWYSGLRSLGANTAILGTAAAVSAAFPPAAPIAIPGALLAMAASSGGSSVAKAQTAGASDLTAAALGTADAFIEYWTEKIGIKYLMDIPGLKNAFLKTAAKFTGAEMIGEQVATIGQDFTDWIALHPEKTVKEFGDERVHAALVTAVATVVGGGGQIALMKGVSALAQRDADKAEAENFGARLSEMAALTAQLETTRLHMPTAQAFWQEIAGDSSVFIDQAKLTETLAEAGVDVSVLPTAAAQMAEARPEGIEIPVSELMTGLANTKAADAIIQHVRMAPDAESIFEHNQPIDKQLEFFQQEATRAVAAETRTAAFNAEVKQIEDETAYQLESVGLNTPLGHVSQSKQANALNAKIHGAWYSIFADKLGVTPLQARDGWVDAAGKKHKGIRLRNILGAPMQGFSHGQAMLNVGLDVGATDRAQKIDADFVKAEIEKMGVKVLSGRNVPGEYELNGQMVKELTYVPRLSRPLTEAEVNQLAVATGQEAIGHYAGGKGDLWGPNAANWGAFNPEFFKDQMGGTLLGEQAALAAQQGGLEQAQSSRRPTTAKKPEDHLGEVPLTVDYTKIEPEKNKQNMALVASYPGIRFKARDAAKRAEEFIQHVTANLLWLHDQIPADIRQRSKRWYDGARAITDRWSAKYGKSDAQIAAILAVYSPQKDWFMNVSLAERTLDIVKNQQDTAWSPEMTEVADKIMADEKFSMLRGAIEGKKLSELKDRLEQAAWLRTFDEAHNNRGHRLVTPEGGFIEFAVSTKNVEKKTGWPGFGTIIKALYVIDDGSPKMIDNALGGEHKVRSFYNNIFHPTSDLGFVTIDTHAVAAGLLRPLSGNSVEVTHNFGGAGTATSAATGMSGTYAYYQEAYRRAAEARGLLPREMQSIAWEAVRELYTGPFKRDAAKMAVVDKLWSEYEKGKRDLDSVRAGILNLAGGVEQPSWVGRDSGISPEGWASTYTGELLGDSVPRRDTGDMDGGAGSGAAGGNAGSLYQAAEVRAGAVSGPVVGIHFSKAERPVLSSSAWGSGMKGAEGDYVRASADKRLRQRIAFYVNTGNGIVPESDVGSHAHLAVLENLYDADADVLKIWRNNPDERVRESAVLDAGFDGFLTRTFGKGGAVVMLGQRNLQPEYLGNYASTAWDLPKELKDKAVAAAQAVHQKLAGDTSREDMRASGKVVQVNSLQDLNETYPEAQAAAFTELLKGFGQPHDAKAVAGFMEGRTGKEALAAVLAEQSAQKLVQDRAAIPPSPEIPAAKALAMELSRNPRLVSGQQSIEGWRKDLERIEPETAKLVDWSKFESGKMYYKADLAATLWQGREQWYFSALENALKAAPAKVFTSGKAVAQWLTANAGKMSVKAAEIEATGITDWLETRGKVTKEDVVAFMAQGGVRLEETVLGAPTAEQQRITAEKQAAFEAYRSELVERYGRAFWGQLDAEERRKYDALNEGTARDEDSTKFSDYQLPGGENYREWLLTLPSKETPEQTRIRLKEKYPDWKEGQRYDSIMSPEDQRDLEQSLEGSKSNFRSSHFDQPNILAHIRTNERTDADGKRVLFIEEIQSDWAQKGRKDGFNVPVTAYQVFVDGVAAGAPYESKIDAYDHKTRALKHNAPDKVEIREVQAMQNAQTAGSKGLVPAAPFVTDTKSWTALALKRMIAHAVENGFDSVAWTTGEQQAARYDLSKQVKTVEYFPGTEVLRVFGLNGDKIMDQAVKPNEIEDHVGKEVAKKLLETPAVESGAGRTKHVVSGDGLKVGGEGMKGYYDGIVPQVANDVLKKLGGGKVETVSLRDGLIERINKDKVRVSLPDGTYRFFSSEQNAQEYLDEFGTLGGDGQQPGFQITQAMRETVSTNGLPLFAGTPKKGSFSPATLDLRLLADADLSTFLHETSHFFLAAYTDMASQPGAPKALVDEVNAILAHLFKTVQGGAQVVTKGGNQLNQTPRKFVPLDEDAVADLWENRAPAARDAVLREFFARQPGELQSWPVVPAGRLKKIWADHAATGVVRDEKGLDTIVEHIVENYVRLEANTALLGHTSDDPVEMLRDYLGDRYSNEELEKDADAFAEYAVDENGAFRLSDYGLFRIAPLVEQLVSATTPEQKLTLIDMVLNVVHQRSDLAAMFVEGGTSTLTDLALFQEVGAGETAPGPLPEGATPLEIWSKMSLDQQRPYHEAWAEQGEQYFMTGKAPSLALESAFRTFANWLKKIYTSVKEFVAGHTGGALHPDTAAFFDRMLATEAEIKLANEKRGFVQLFKDAAEAGMTERGFADYTALTDEQREDAEAMLRTRSLRDMKWLQNSRDKVIAALQADAKEARAAVRKTIAEELAATPLRKAMRWLKTGEMTQPDGTEIKAPGGFKMTKADVEALFPPGALADRPDLSRLRGMTATEGLAPDLVAEMFDGFTSGEDLVRQLAAAPKFNDEVEALTNQRMLEEHSDLVDPDAIAKAADAAIHNDAHIRLAATELAALNSRIGSVAALTRAAKEYARQLIETKTSRTLKPWQFAAADTRARKAAAKALRKGERDEAAAQMRTALVNAAATKLAYDAEDDIKKITDRFKKIAGYKDTDSAFKSRDAELVNAVRAILADFGIGTKGKSAREYLAVVQQHNPDLAAVLSDTIDAVTENAKDWQQLKISELRDLAEEIDGLWFLAKRSKQIEIDGKVMPLHEAQQALYDRLDALGIPDRVPGEGSAVTPAEKRGILFDRFVGALRRVEAWVGAKDGTLTGPFRTYMWNPIRDAADAYRADKAKYLKAYRDLLTPIAPTLTRRLIEAPELGYTFGKDDGGMGKAELLHAILHTGNESNKRKLLLGRGWATATENSFDTSKWDAFVQRMHDEGVLTKADYDFAQGAWNLLDNMKPLAQKAHRDVFGKYFAEVTANEFTNQFGTYAGGYVPAMTDPLIVRDAELNKLRDGEEGSMAYAFPTTAKGFTKSRVEYNRPLKLDLRTLSQHIDKVLLFGHMTRPVNDVRRVMSGKAVAQALGRVDPQAYNTLIMPWLNRAAKQVVETPTPGREGLGRFWSVVRARAGMAAMFANVANSAQQITGLSLAAVRVRPALLLDAMAKYAASPATFAEHVTSKSSYMATRLENEVSMLSDQINDILLNPSIYESAKNWTSKHAYFMQSAVDSVISPVVWLGGYNQAIEAGMSETDAVRAGDSAVRETQGSQAPEDVAAFETGSAFYRMFVQFAGYFNMNANLLGTEFVKLSRDMGLKKGAGRGLYVLTLGFLAPAIAGELIIQLFRGGPDDDDKDGEYLDDWLVALFGYAPLRYATAMVPGIGPAVNATVNTLNNKPYDDRISTAPAISMIEAAVKAPIDLYKAIVEDGKPSKAIKEIATLISMTVGVPASAAAKPASYLADVAAGRVAPTSIPDAVRGTITGTASPASKQ